MLRMLSGPRKNRQVAVLISGGGSTLQSLLELQHQINISVVITSSKTAVGALKARRFGIPVHFLDRPVDFSEVSRILSDYKIDFVILAGFMKILPPDFVQEWESKIVNIHPSLLPDFPGLNSAERSWQSNTNMGVTLHRVTAEMDEGPIFLQMQSLPAPQTLKLDEAEIFLRRSEQHLLREMILRYF